MSTGNRPSEALDFATLYRAWRMYMEQYPQGMPNLGNASKGRFFTWAMRYGHLADMLDGMQGLVSSDEGQLEADLAEMGHSVEGIQIPAGMVAVAAVMNKQAEWHGGKAEDATVNMASGASIPGFELPEAGVHIFQLVNYPGAHLLHLRAKGPDSVWILHAPAVAESGIDMITMSHDVMQTGRTQVNYPGAKIPNAYLDLHPDISWMVGIGEPPVGQALQGYKLGLSKYGAFLKVVTVLAPMCADDPWAQPDLSKPYEVKDPFYVWWTQQSDESLFEFPFGQAFVAEQNMVKPPEDECSPLW